LQVTDIEPKGGTTIPQRKRKAARPKSKQLQRIFDLLEAMKAEDIAVVDLKGRSILADYMLIASGASQRQIQAIAERIREELKTEHTRKVSIEGLTGSDWVLVDAGEVIVHLFRPEARKHYALEKMWSESLFQSDQPQAGMI
jgi:ribosome silencing factor RsfS/YbeB/iojap